ncbi:hypothetical protein [Akkermansia sp.]|uniref:hypothetical protein n=1 Tax=Akkermansia sp. TaxID=1872421 RepID=UPI0025BD19D6|nr:hypothetical protein [Akkermansia sp.]MCC8149104.1 hypothetical protein [Akkermansia sp.]
MKKLGCLIFVVLGFLVTSFLFVRGGGKEIAKKQQVQLEENQESPNEVKSHPEKKEKSKEYHQGYDNGYLVGKTAASEGRPMREYTELKRHGSILGNGNEDYADGFYFGWRAGYRARSDYMKSIGEKPKPYNLNY